MNNKTTLRFPSQSCFYFYKNLDIATQIRYDVRVFILNIKPFDIHSFFEFDIISEVYI